MDELTMDTQDEKDNGKTKRLADSRDASFDLCSAEKPRDYLKMSHNVVDAIIRKISDELREQDMIVYRMMRRAYADSKA